MTTLYVAGGFTVMASDTPGSVVAPTLPGPDHEADRDAVRGISNRYGVVMSVSDLPGNTQKVVLRLNDTQRETMGGGGVRRRIVTLENPVHNNPGLNIPLKPGARVLLKPEKNPENGRWRYRIVDRDRTPAIFILGTLFILAVLLIGGSEVTRHALLISLMAAAFQTTLFPLVMQSRWSLLWLGLTCFTFTSLAVFIYGSPGSRTLSREQLVVMLGTFGGLGILGAILWIMGEITPLNGYSTEGLVTLWGRAPRMDYWTFFLSGALIGFQGLLFYVCWTLAQTRREESGQEFNFWDRFGITMQRGRRLLGPIISSVGLLLLGLMAPMLLQLYGTPTARFINLESSASILIYAFSGGLTLILTVPLTALLAAWLMTPRLKKAANSSPEENARNTGLRVPQSDAHLKTKQP